MVGRKAPLVERIRLGGCLVWVVYMLCYACMSSIRKRSYRQGISRSRRHDQRASHFIRLRLARHKPDDFQSLLSNMNVSVFSSERETLVSVGKQTDPEHSRSRTSTGDQIPMNHDVFLNICEF